MATAADAYEALVASFKRMHALEHAESMLMWDQMVHVQPKCAPARTASLAELGRIKHERQTAPELATQLDACEADIAAGGELSKDAIKAANVREMRRVWAEHKNQP